MRGISVVIACFEDGAFIEECIESVVAHNTTGLPMEIILVDDCSPDNLTQRALERLEQRTDLACPITILRLSENSGGPARPRNVGVEMAQYDYIFIIDSDNKLNSNPDLLQESGNFFEQAIHILDDAPQTAMIFPGLLTFGAQDGDRPNLPLSARTAIAVTGMDACTMFRKSDFIPYDTTAKSREDSLFGAALLEKRFNEGEGLKIVTLDEQDWHLYRTYGDGSNVHSRPLDWPAYFQRIIEAAPNLCRHLFPDIRSAENKGQFLQKTGLGYENDPFTLAAQDRDPNGVIVASKLLNTKYGVPENISWQQLKFQARKLG